MPLAMWAKTAVGTNLPFLKGFGKAVKSWRDILHQTIQRKVAAKPQVPQTVDVGLVAAKQRCLLLNRTGIPLQSRIFRSLFARNFSKSLASELRRRSALRLSSCSARSFRHVPIMSLIGVTLGLDVPTVIDDSAEKIMAEMRNKFRSYTWQTEPLEKLPQSLGDLDINPQSIASGCEGAVYKAKVKVDAGIDSPSSCCDRDGGYDLAVKAVFNYGAESNSHSIIQTLEREIVPLRAEGCQVDSLGKDYVNRLPPHPNIVEMPGIFVDDMLVTEEGLRKFPAALPHRLNPELHYGRNKTLYLVMRRRSTHLRDYLANNEIPMETRCLMLAQLLEGVSHMGQHGIAHRDLKSDNVLVDVPDAGGVPRLEICDFGCCLVAENKSLVIPYPTRDMYIGGNSWLMAPELVTATPGSDSFLDFSKSDLWAVGAIAYEILGGENPFYPSRGHERKQLSSRSYTEEDLPALPGDVPSPVKRLVKALLCRDPRKPPPRHAPIGPWACGRPSASVAATVVQMVVLDSGGCRNSHTGRIGRIARKTALNGRKTNNKRLTQLSDALYKERQKFMWVMVQSLSMLCRLIFGSQSENWDVKSVMNFMLLSRLNYADFREALKFL
ncbi:unnamed protein product [Candidula unifasciata]|uniref:non-specific serine/threonine protein kinase n=1 Tax=Candidula unifasciata TaxID=100452 RepID=A0A8S3YNU1_9EUPU|nr:unnamed protein product [Candidula unifasciata]